MRLLQSVLPGCSQPQQPQQKFVAQLLRLLLMFPGHATFRHLRRYSSYHARAVARWYARDGDVVSRNQAAIMHGSPPEHAPADDIMLSHQVLTHVQCQCPLRVVLVVDTTPNRNAVLFRTDVDLDALPIARYYKARFPIELL